MFEDALEIGFLHSDIKYLLRAAHDDAQHFLDQTKVVPTPTQALLVCYLQEFNLNLNECCGIEPDISIMEDVLGHELALLPDLQFHYRSDTSCRILISFKLCGKDRIIWTHSRLSDPGATSSGN